MPPRPSVVLTLCWSLPHPFWALTSATACRCLALVPQGVYLYTLNLETAVTQIITTVKEWGRNGGHSAKAAPPPEPRPGLPPRRTPPIRPSRRPEQQRGGWGWCLW